MISKYVTRWIPVASLAFATNAGAAPAVSPSASSNSYAVAAYLLGILVVFMSVAIIILASRLSALKSAQPLVQTETEPSPEPAESPEMIEERKQAIVELLRSLTSCVGELLKNQASYDNKMEGHRIAIRKAMTLAGLEEIGRLILSEIEEMRLTGQSYRAQLDEAHQRIHEQNEQLIQIQADARIDHLTQLSNRRALESRLGEEIERSRRYGSPFSLIAVDIDHFKQVNDTYGHLAGDKMLQLVALLLKNNIRANDFPARFGGEEFVVLLPETAMRPARQVAEKIRRVIEESALMHERQRIRVTISAGVGELEPQTDTAETLFNRADEALYNAKHSGRNRVESTCGPEKPEE